VKRSGPTTLKTTDKEKLLWAIGLSHLMREKRKKTSDDAATNGDFGTSFMQNHVA